MFQSCEVTVGETSARGQGQDAGFLPADVQTAGAGFHAHAVGGHALEYPSDEPAGHRLVIVGGLRDRGPEHPDRAVVVAADQARHADVQDAGETADRKVDQPAFDMVPDSAFPTVGGQGVDTETG